MKNLFLSLSCILIFITSIHIAVAQTGPGELWNYFAGGSKDESAEFVLECTDGGSLLVGSTRSNDGMVTNFKGASDAWIVKRRNNGTAEWQSCIGASSYDYAHQAVEVSDGYVVVGKKNNDAWVFKLNKSGSLLWEKTYPTGNQRSSELYAIHKKSDGSFLVGGYTNGYYSNAMIWNLNSSGNLINGVSYQIGNVIKEIRNTSDGNILIMGDYYNSNEAGCFGGEVPAKGDVWIAKVSNNTYDPIWSRYYGGTTADYFVDGEINANNEVYIIGTTLCKGSITGPNNIGATWPLPDRAFNWLAKINASGTLTHIIIVTSSPFLLDVGWDYHCVTTDCKGLPVVGGVAGGFLGRGASIVKYKSDLSESIWYAELSSSTDISRELLDIRFTKDGAYLASGTWNEGNDHYFVLKTEKDPDCTGPANKCQNITLISCGQTFSGNTAGRTSSFGISDLSSCYTSTNPFSAGDQLFEIYKPNNNGDLVVTLFSTNIDHDIFLLSTCNPVQCLYRSVNSVATNGNNIEIIRVPNAPAGHYYVLVDGPTTSQVGPFTLTVNCGLLDCGNAKPIECKQTLINESTSSGVNNVSLYCNPSRISDPGTGCTGKERVYTFLLNSNQNVTITLNNIRNQANDFEMFLFRECNEDVCLGSSTNPKGQNEIIGPINLSAGRYYIVVDGWKNSEGNYDISVDWNCCSNPLEVFNCGYVTYRYSGNGSNLQFTFTSNRAIAPGKKWKVGNNEINIAGSTTFQYNFPSPGEYIICFPYLNANNCVEYCCYRVWISNPFDCFDFDYTFNPTSNNYSFRLNAPGATNISWKDDNTGGTIGGGPISNPIPAPPAGGCIERTITVSYYLNGRWYLCCRKIWICNPFDCYEFDYRFDLNSNGMVFQLNTPGATNITWKDDTGGGDIGGGPISNPVPVPPNPGDCIERIISVKYFYNGRWYICCKRFWLCDPQICASTIQSTVNLSGQVQLSVSQSYTSVRWIDQKTGATIGLGNSIQRTFSYGSTQEICVQYNFDGKTYMCCKNLLVVGTSESDNTQNNIEIYPNPNNGLFQLKWNSANSDITDIRFFNLHGVEQNEVMIQKDPYEKTTIDASRLVPGVYLIHIHTKNGIIVKQVVLF